MVLSSWPWSLREFTQFIWWMQTERRVAANPQTKPTDLGCESVRQCALPEHIGTTWRIRLNRPSAAMWSYVKLLWPLVCFVVLVVCSISELKIWSSLWRNWLGSLSFRSSAVHCVVCVVIKISGLVVCVREELILHCVHMHSLVMRLHRGANDLHMVHLMPLPPHHLLLQ